MGDEFHRRLFCAPLPQSSSPGTADRGGPKLVRLAAEDGSYMAAGFAAIIDEGCAESATVIQSYRRALLVQLGARRPDAQAGALTSFAPVALTPDELGTSWSDGRVLLKCELSRCGNRLRIEARWPGAGPGPFGVSEDIIDGPVAALPRPRAGDCTLPGC